MKNPENFQNWKTNTVHFALATKTFVHIQTIERKKKKRNFFGETLNVVLDFFSVKMKPADVHERHTLHDFSYLFTCFLFEIQLNPNIRMVVVSQYVAFYFFLCCFLILLWVLVMVVL